SVDSMSLRHYGPGSCVIITTRSGVLGTGLLAERLEEVGEGAALDDAAELGLVVGHQTHAIDVQVVDGPAVARLVQPVLDLDLRALGGDDPGLHESGIALHALARIADGLPGILLDLA